jgi:hypothetical protein
MVPSGSKFYDIRRITLTRKGRHGGSNSAVLSLRSKSSRPNWSPTRGGANIEVLGELRIGTLFRPEGRCDFGQSQSRTDTMILGEAFFSGTT